MLGALGIVYGDIGTSVLYAMKATFFASHFHLERTPENVLGALSLFFWSLIVVVTIKYILLIMRADNEGEGGIFALLALIRMRKSKVPSKVYLGISAAILLGAALLYGDGVITPAISVLSAVEGLEVVTPALKSAIVPITIAILTALFLIQSSGTHKIGGLFGPVVIVWLVCNAVLGMPWIWRHPEVLGGLNPFRGLEFLLAQGARSVYILGAVVLCVTGGEALYADMGHFGAKAIRLSWLTIVLPCLVINYFGQGGRLLTPGDIPNDNLFYSLAPRWALYPLVALATAATIIASQALISGAYSLTQQAIALGVFPRLRVVHTNPGMEGQIYIPGINYALLAGCITLVLGFRTSDALASAYGIAVTGTMAVTTAAFYIVARYTWNWNVFVIGPVCAALIAVDLTFFGANALKFFEGGFVPVLIAVSFFVTMQTWEWGRQLVASRYQARGRITIGELTKMKRDPAMGHIETPLVVLSSRPVTADTDFVPPPLESRMSHLKGVVYRHLVIVTVVSHRSPYTNVSNPEDRYTVIALQESEYGTLYTVMAMYGYMETPNLKTALRELHESGALKIPLPIREWSILVGAENISLVGLSGLDRLRLRFFRRMLANAPSAAIYFGLTDDNRLTTETVQLDVIPNTLESANVKSAKA